MDRLSDIPPKNDTVPTPEENDVLTQFFDDEGMDSSPPGNTQDDVEDVPSGKKGLDWKLAGATAVLFIALANPWIDGLVCKIPYCGNAVGTLVVKGLLFLILFIVLSVFL